MKNISSIDSSENTKIKTKEIPSAIQIVSDASQAWEDLRAGKLERRTQWFSKSTSRVYPSIQCETFDTRKVRIREGNRYVKKDRFFANLYGAYLLSKRKQNDTGLGLNLLMIHRTLNPIEELLDCVREGSLYWENENTYPPYTKNGESGHLFEELRPYIPKWYSKQNTIPFEMSYSKMEDQQEMIQKLDDFLKEIIKNYNETCHA
jgi:hypothetical protein